MLIGKTITEHSRVALTQDVPGHRLKAGDVGTIVHVYGAGEAYEVEFLSLTGETLAVATVTANQVRPVAAQEVANARRLAS